MKVKEAIEALQKLNPDSELMISSDDEGNSYRKMTGFDGHSIYDADNESMYSDTWTASEACMEKDEWDEFKQRPRTIVVY